MKKQFLTKVCKNLFLFSAVLYCACDKSDNPFPDPEIKPGLTTLITIPFSDNFNYGTSVAEYAIPLTNWAEAVVPEFKTDRGWGYSATKGQSATGAMKASAYGGQLGTDNTYLITGPYNFNAYPVKYISFDLYPDYGSDPGTLRVKYSSNYSGSGNPEAGGVTWTEITDITTKLPLTDKIWKTVISNLSALTGSTVYLAFHFKDGNELKSKQFYVDNFVLSDTALTTDTIGAGITFFNKNFEDNSLTSGGWKEYSVTGTEKWATSTFGGDYFAKMTGFVSPSNFVNEDWLISPSFNPTSYNQITLTFETATKYTGDTLGVYVSTNYDGTSNPAIATWTKLSVTLSTGNFTWAPSGNIDISSFKAASTYVAFKYTSTTTASATWEVDDVIITGK